MSTATHPAIIDWLASSSIAHSFNAADPWIFATFMTIHLLGLALGFGTSLLLNLRLLGLGLRASSAAHIARTLRNYLLAGLAIGLTSGLWLFIADVLKFWANPIFKAKLVLLLVVGVGQIWLLRQASKETVAARTLAALTIVLWLGTIVLGRLIGLV